MRELIRKTGLYACFVDFKMAFDSIDRTLLFDKLEKLPGMDPVCIRQFVYAIDHANAVLSACVCAYA